MKNDDKSIDLVTSWMVESKFSIEEFEEYGSALSKFNKISKEGTQVILYEMKKNPSDGRTVKKTPLLNSKKTKTKTKSTLFKSFIYSRPKDKYDIHPKNKNEYKGFKVRIFLLIIVLLAFIIIVFFMNSIGGESSSVTSVHSSTLFGIDNSS